MSDISNPRSSPIRMGEGERLEGESLEDAVRSAARDTVRRTVPSAIEQPTISPDQQGHADAINELKQQPAPSMATPREPAPASETEQRFYRSIDDVEHYVNTELDGLEKQIQELRDMMKIGGRYVKDHIGHYLRLGETSMDMARTIGERLADVRKQIDPTGASQR